MNTFQLSIDYIFTLLIFTSDYILEYLLKTKIATWQQLRESLRWAMPCPWKIPCEGDWLSFGEMEQYEVSRWYFRAQRDQMWQDSKGPALVLVNHNEKVEHISWLSNWSKAEFKPSSSLVFLFPLETRRYNSLASWGLFLSPFQRLRTIRGKL